MTADELTGLLADAAIYPSAAQIHDLAAAFDRRTADRRARAIRELGPLLDRFDAAVRDEKVALDRISTKDHGASTREAYLGRRNALDAARAAIVSWTRGL